MQNKYQKGSAILITLMILGVVLVTALSVALVTIQEMKGSRGAAKTTATYQTADEGVEAVMYDIIKGDRKTSDKLLNCQNDGTVGSSSLGYRVILMDKDDNIIHCKNDRAPISDIKRIKSVGTFGNESQRSVDASIPVSCNGTTDDNDTKLLLHFDGGDDGDSFVDATGNHTVQKNGDAKIESSPKKFCKSAYFDGNNDNLSVDSSSDFDFGNEDFTIDLWVNPELVDGKRRNFFSISDASASSQNSGIYLGINHNDHWYYSVGNEACDSYWSSEVPSSFSIQPQTDVWAHIALVRDGDNLRFFINGENAGVDSNSLSTDAVCSLNSKVYVGNEVSWGASDGNGDYAGNIDELRISKGVARWKNDFTPPSYPY